jgi:hypothetical protein
MEQYSVKCRFCDVLLVGREQFIGHMFHNHEMEYDRLEQTWQSMAAGLCLNNNGHYNQPWHKRPGSQRQASRTMITTT